MKKVDNISELLSKIHLSLDLYELFCRWFPKKIPNTYSLFLCLLFFSIMCLLFVHPPLHWWNITILFIAGVHIFLIIRYAMDVALLGWYRAMKEKKKTWQVRGYTRMVVLLLLNYIQMIVWFAVLYRNSNTSFVSTNIPLNSIWGSLYFSIVTMTTLGYGDVIPKAIIGYLLVYTHILIGFFMTLVILARFITLLPIPKTLDKDERDWMKKNPGNRGRF